MARSNKSNIPLPPPPPPVISREESAMMKFLRNFYSPGQLQIALCDYIDGFPKDMPKKERQLRIRAIKLMGYKDIRNKHTVDEEN